ncbi:MAG: hypothetical protein RIC14_00200 [Filomicrobium sp.]
MEVLDDISVIVFECPADLYEMHEHIRRAHDLAEERLAGCDDIVPGSEESDILDTMNFLYALQGLIGQKVPASRRKTTPAKALEDA